MHHDLPPDAEDDGSITTTIRTAGALDDELLFYLKARGIPQKEAEALMIQAFIGEAIEGISNEAIRDALNERTREWLAART